MNETKTKRRGWVKNVIIIFLVVMLLLTFFSNTIMNHSLPEVAAQYVSSGTINARIRGSGQVTALDSYEVTLSQTRKIHSVFVHEGDMVEAGAPLFELEGTESSELAGARETLEDLELNYRRAVLQAAEADYTRENRDIQLAREELANLEAERDKNIVTDQQMEQAKSDVSSTQQRLDILNVELEALQEQMNNLGGGGSSDSLITSLWNAVQNARSALTQAQNTLESHRISYGADYEQFRTRAIEEKMRPDAQADVLARTYLNNKSYDWWLRYLADPQDATLDPAPTESDANAAAGTLEELQARVASLTDETLASAAWVSRQSVYMEALALDIQRLGAEAGAEDTRLLEAYNAISSAERAVAQAQSAYNAANQEYSSAAGSDNTVARTQLQRQIDNKNSEIKMITSRLSDYQTALKELEDKQAAYKNYEEQIKASSRSLEDLIFNLSEQQREEERNEALQSLELEQMRKQIERQQQIVDELAGEATSSQITAPVAGRVTNISVTAGKENVPDTPLAVIEVVERGYILSFSVTTDQAKRLQTGTAAEITSYYWGSDLTAVLTSIRNDPSDPSKSRLLTFSIRGEVESGTTLSLSIGERSQPYDMIVPSSAVRSDSNGSFVLTVVAKSSPLGNRYVAQRVNVTELAKDDTNTAISGGLSSSDFVITTATKPVEAGMQVRMAEG